MEKNVGIMGFGEVGQAIAKFYSSYFVMDINRNEFPEKIDILHVCIPPQKVFVAQVLKTIATYSPNMVIIHSTVPVGTTRKIMEHFNRVVHSPVRGVHPHLHEHIRENFVKYIGADSVELGEEVAAHFRDIGMQEVVVVHTPEATELLKELDTTYYGLCIAFHSYAKKICDKTGVDYDMVMTHANKSYNEGYLKVGKANVVRPVLYPPEDDTIGGHCVIPNAKLLKKQFGSDPILQAILRHDGGITAKMPIESNVEVPKKTKAVEN